MSEESVAKKGDLSVQEKRALVLIGPPGSGKTTKARELASARGAYCEIEGPQLDSPFQDWLDEKAKTVIVDGFPNGAEARRKLKALITSDRIQVNRKMQKPFDRPTPNFIFCTSEWNPLCLSESDRRFRIVHLPEKV